MYGSEWRRAWSESAHTMISVCQSSPAYAHLLMRKKRRLHHDDAAGKWQDESKKGHRHLYSGNGCARRRFPWSPHLREEREAEMHWAMSATIFTRVHRQMTADMVRSSSRRPISSPSLMKVCRRRVQHTSDPSLSCSMCHSRTLI